MRPTASLVRELLEYDPATGVLRWRVFRGGSACAGSVAGTLDSHGHRQLRVEGRLYMAHQIIWLHVTGEWPEHVIDHRDNDRDNNRFGNFRPATGAVNARNRLLNKNSTSGLKGAHFEKKAGRWRGQIRVNGKAKFLGYFDDAAGAHAAYVAASREFHGEFGRVA